MSLIYPGGALSYIPSGTPDLVCFVETFPDGRRTLRFDHAIPHQQTIEFDRVARSMHFEAADYPMLRIILSEESESPDRIRIATFILFQERTEFAPPFAELPIDSRNTFSFISEDGKVVRYEADGRTYVARSNNVVGARIEVPQRLLDLSDEDQKTALQRLGRALYDKRLQKAEESPVAWQAMQSIADEWGFESVEETYETALFFTPSGNQAVYIAKEDDDRTSLWLMDTESAETMKVVDDIDIESPARPEALVAYITDGYFAFVRDGRTIWTYEKGTLRQIFPRVRK
jgi:hypothetical protein